MCKKYKGIFRVPFFVDQIRIVLTKRVILLYSELMSSILNHNITIKPYTGEVDNQRYREHYGWLHIAGDNYIASQVGHDSNEFQLALKWYANFRHLINNKNDYLDDIIDNKLIEWNNINRQDYDLHYREFLIKGLRWFG